MSRKIKIISVIAGIFLLLILIFGVYALPLLPKNWVDTDPDMVANQIASINYLLTFIATIGTIGGIGFTIFGFYQAVKIPEIINKEIQKHIERINQVDENQQKIIKELDEKIDESIERVDDRIWGIVMQNNKDIETIYRSFRIMESDIPSQLEEYIQLVKKIEKTITEKDSYDFWERVSDLKKEFSLCKKDFPSNIRKIINDLIDRISVEDEDYYMDSIEIDWREKLEECRKARMKLEDLRRDESQKTR